jgi:response regulator RpfG family c-di-GMP phosphodiesterase
MRMLPQVVMATTAVVALPVALVWWLRASALVSSSWLCLLLAIALSILISAAGSAYWQRRDGSERVVFSELLLWGWIRRLRLEHQLATMVQTLQPRTGVPAETSAESLRALAAALDAQDPYTEGHSRRVARHAAMVARELHLSDEEVERVRTAAAMHDVGKLRVPPALLSKPGRLTPDEFDAIKCHATEGATIVAGLGDAELAAIVRHHHERFDGTGYPSGLGGANIPLGARIVAVADTFDAITSIRPYRGAAPHKQALDHLLQASGTQLDPAAVRAFLRYYTGRKGSMLWAGLTVVPQRLFAWMHGSARSAGNLAFGEVAATIGGIVAVGVAAMGTAAAVGVPRGALHRPSSALIAQRAAPAAGAAGRSVGASAAARSSGHAAAGRASAASPAAGKVSAVSRHGVNAPRAARPAGSSPRAGNRAAPGVSQPGGGRPPTPNSGQASRPGGHHRGAGGPSGSGGSPGSAPPHAATPVTNPAPTVAAPVTPPAPTAGGGAPPAAPNSPPAAPVTGAGTSAGSPGPTPGPTSPPPGVVPPTPPAPPSRPTSMDQCKRGGYAHYGFDNQGQCVASVMSH